MTNEALYIPKLAVVGVGLIGGSLALALKATGSVGQVIGIGRGQANLDKALELRVVDSITRDLAAGVADADVVFLATPVLTLGPVARQAMPHLKAGAILTDGGSVKQAVIDEIEPFLRDDVHFVPGHPIAGTEHTGATAAFATLFQRRNVVLTPSPATDADALRRVADLWRACGAQVRTLDAGMHDRIFAAVSHLPHLLAFALVEELAMRPNAEDIFRYAASGFRDFTRIAAGSPEMWRDISLANRDPLLAEVAAFRAQLDRIAAMLTAGDAVALEAAFARASSARRAWGAQHGVAASVPADGSREP